MAFVNLSQQGPKRIALAEVVLSIHEVLQHPDVRKAVVAVGSDVVKVVKSVGKLVSVARIAWPTA